MTSQAYSRWVRFTRHHCLFQIYVLGKTPERVEFISWRQVMPGPLSGFRIIDATQMISGPMATMILADQGADVIKVEPPGSGDLTRALVGRRHTVSPAFEVVNRNKRSVVVDLKQPRGVALLQRLVKRADLFVQNFRPGTAERMGIGETALREARVDLVYVSISGFG